MRRALSAIFFFAAVIPACAADADGIWRCKMTGDIPIGIVTIAGDDYEFQAVNSSFEPVDNSSNGSGTLTYEDGYLIPQSGPLLSEFGVTGALTDGQLWWNNNSGSLMRCAK